MKKIKITLGESDIKLLEGIFDNDANFEPQCVEDHLLINVMRQCVDPGNILEAPKVKKKRGKAKHEAG